MKLEQRIRVLEGRLFANLATLYFADGSKCEILGPRYYLFELLRSACDEDKIGPAQAAHLDLIRGCVASREPNGGHMVELIQSLLRSPAEAPTNPCST